MAKKTRPGFVSFDVMSETGRYVGTIEYPIPMDGIIDADELKAFVERKFPSLRGTDFKVKFNGN